MRKIWKIALAITVVLGIWGAAAQAQPLITGNTAAFGCGPILTSNFQASCPMPGQTCLVHSFYPDGAGPGCPDPPPTNTHNGRGMAVGGTEVFYTELDEIPGPFPGFGASEFIHVANYNSGAGSGDVRLLPNPRPGSGIQDLTFANSVMYVLTGYDTQVPIVYKVDFITGDKLAPTSGITIQRVGDVDDSVDGFAVLPNGNFLMNNKGTSCIYAEYDKTDGHFIGNIINVPGGPARCTGVDTDGTSLYFLTDPTISAGITRTDFAGNMNGFNFFDGPGSEVAVEDISLVHPVTSITNVNPANLFFTMKTTDDIGTKFDFQVELLKNGSVVASGIGFCKTIQRNLPGTNTAVPINLPSDVALASGDVLAARVSARIGTAVAPATCAGHVTATGARFFYDSTNAPSQFTLTISPNPPATLFFHSDGVPCSNTLTTSDSGSTAAGRILDDIVPTAANPKCQNVGTLDGRAVAPPAVTNPWVLFGTWSLAPLP